MNKGTDLYKEGANNLFEQDQGHLKFSSYQAPIKKSYSLRKVETNYPPHRPEIH